MDKIPMAGLPLIGLVVAIILVLLTAYLFLRHTFSFRVLLLLEAVLTVFITVVVFPQSIDYLMAFFQVGVRGLFVLTVGVLGAYLLIYGLYIMHTKQERMIVKLIQEIALLRYQIECQGSERETDTPDI
jgi:hypothetical protein